MSEQTHTASPEPDLWEVSLANFPMLPVLHDVNPLLDRIDELTAVLKAVDEWVDDLGLFADFEAEPAAVFKEVKRVLGRGYEGERE